MISGGLDIGGTKIEARLFDESMGLRDSRRVPTPRDSADSFFTALAGQVVRRDGQVQLAVRRGHRGDAVCLDREVTGSAGRAAAELLGIQSPERVCGSACHANIRSRSNLLPTDGHRQPIGAADSV